MLFQSEELKNPEQDINAGDIVIVLMGSTGTGKSNVIDVLTGQREKRANAGLRSRTQKIDAVRLKGHGMHGDRIVLVDTPGYNDTHALDVDISCRFREWMHMIFSQQILVHAFVYLHRITDNRVTNSACSALDDFALLCKEQNQSNIVLLTTFWDDVKQDKCAERELQFKTQYWDPRINNKTSVIRFQNNFESACNVIDHITANVCRSIADIASNSRLRIYPDFGRTTLEDGDIIILFIGATRSGKSTIVDLLSSQPGCRSGSGLGLQPCTKVMDTIRIRGHPVYQDRIVLVDTPGFNGEPSTDLETLRIICQWLNAIHNQRIELRGIICTHRINENRANNIHYDVLYIVQQLCGPAAFQNVILLKTIWDKVGEPGTGLQVQYGQKHSHWSVKINPRADIQRFGEKWHKSSWDIIDKFLDTWKTNIKCLQIQREMVEDGKVLRDTTAALALSNPRERKKVVVLLLGLTGAGKSNFIKIAADHVKASSVDLPHVTQDLTSFDSTVKHFPIDHPQRSTTLLFIDTPGFDHYAENDKKILKNIVEFIKKPAFDISDVKFGGILYLHDISESKLQSNIGTLILSQLKVPEPIGHVLLATTKWNKSVSIIESVHQDNRHQELVGVSWGTLIRNGAQACKFDDSATSAWELIDLLLDRQPLEMHIAQENLECILSQLSSRKKRNPVQMLFQRIRSLIARLL